MTLAEDWPATTAAGADGLLAEGLTAVPKVLASNTMNWVEARGSDVLLGDVVFAVIVPDVIITRMFCAAGGVFW